MFLRQAPFNKPVVVTTNVSNIDNAAKNMTILNKQDVLINIQYCYPGLATVSFIPELKSMVLSSVSSWWFSQIFLKGHYEDSKQGSRFEESFLEELKEPI